eukprot:gene7684-12150_t
MNYFWYSFGIFSFLFIYIYNYTQNNRRQIEWKFKVSDLVEFSNDSTNFCFAIITSIGTSYDLLFNYETIFSQKDFSIVESHHQIFDKWIYITLGYLIVDLFSMGFLTSKGTLKRRIHYFIFHSVIVFAYLSVLLNRTGGIVIIITLWGELYTVFLHYSYFKYPSHYLFDAPFILHYFDIFLFFFNRIFAIFLLEGRLFYEIFLINKFYNTVIYIQFIFVSFCLLFNLNNFFEDIQLIRNTHEVRRKTITLVKAM